MGDDGQRISNVSRRDFVRKGAAAGLGAAALGSLVGEDIGAQSNEVRSAERTWDYVADFVTIGAGVAGLAGAVSALEHGASVIMVEENFDIGGHGMVSGGNVHLGGGTSRQRRHGIEDSADRVFEDWIRHDHHLSRYSDRELVRAFADENAATFEWLIENDVEFHDHVLGPDKASTVARQGRTIQWPVYEELITSHPTRMGSGLVRALEKSAREKGAQILLRHQMTEIIRENQFSGRVLGVRAVHQGRSVEIRATRGVLVATGGHSSNVEFRRIFDPRLTEEYQTAGEPYSRQSADGEMAAMDIGATLWGTASQTSEDSRILVRAAHIGCQWGYGSLHWQPDSPIFDQVRASGLTGVYWQNAIMVNQTGRRFWDEMDFSPEFFAAAMAYNGNPERLNGGGPIWAIFDADAVERQNWDPTPPNVDLNGFFFSGDTIRELAERIRNPYQSRPMPVAAVEETVARYNSFVDSGVDEDFHKPSPEFKILRPPFYAAWATPMMHDTVTGLRTNVHSQVMDVRGDVIPGLYCAGESQGGFAQHGLGRTLVFGRIAGRHAALYRGEA